MLQYVFLPLLTRGSYVQANLYRATVTLPSSSFARCNDGVAEVDVDARDDVMHRLYL